MPSIRTKPRRILLPRTLSNRLNDHTLLNEETAGALIYFRQASRTWLDLRVQTMYMTGVGDRNQVEIQPSSQSVIDKFLRQSPRYGSIEWHTHPSGSPEVSIDDRYHYLVEMKENPQFLAYIVTRNKRTVIKPYGTESVLSYVINDPPDFQSRENYLRNRLIKVAEELGIVAFRTLRASKPKPSE